MGRIGADEKKNTGVWKTTRGVEKQEENVLERSKGLWFYARAQDRDDLSETHRSEIHFTIKNISIIAPLVFYV